MSLRKELLFIVHCNSASNFMFNFNNKNTSIVDFEQVNAGWETYFNCCYCCSSVYLLLFANLGAVHMEVTRPG